MSTQNDGWIKISERKPKFNEMPAWVSSSVVGRGIYMVYHSEVMDWSTVTHWQPATLPAPPAKELTQREKDEEAAILEWNCYPSLPRETERAIFLAGFRAALAYRDVHNQEDIEQFSLGPVISKIPVGAIKNLRRRCGLDT